MANITVDPGHTGDEAWGRRVRIMCLVCQCVKDKFAGKRTKRETSTLCLFDIDTCLYNNSAQSCRHADNARYLPRLSSSFEAATATNKINVKNLRTQVISLNQQAKQANTHKQYVTVFKYLLR